MARIKWNTEYNRIEVLGGSGENYTDVYSGTFVLIKLRGELFFYEPTLGHIHPVCQVLRADLA